VAVAGDGEGLTALEGVRDLFGFGAQITLGDLGWAVMAPGQPPGATRCHGPRARGPRPGFGRDVCQRSYGMEATPRRQEQAVCFRAPKRRRRRSRRTGGHGTYVDGIRTPTDVPLTPVPFPCVHDDTGRESADAEERQAGDGGGMGPGRAEPGGRRPVARRDKRRGGSRSGRRVRAAPVRGGAVAADRGALLLCGVFAGKRSNGIRVTVIVIKALGLLSGVLGLLQGGAASRFSRASPSPSPCCGGFSSAEARNWFDQ